MIRTKWHALVRAIRSGIDKALNSAGIEPMGADDTLATPISTIPDMNPPKFELYCDGELLHRSTDEELAESLYDNTTGLHKELYRVAPGQVAEVLRKTSYGVEVTYD